MSKKKLAVIILAAGKGTRMGGQKAKVMHKLAGLPMINWLIKTAEQLKPEKIVVVVGPDMKDLEEAIKPHTAALQKERDGTGGAAKVGAHALKDFDGDVLILLGDAPMVSKTTMENLIAARTKNQAGLSMLGCVLQDPFGYGRVILDDKGLVQDIVEERDASPEQKQIKLMNAGAFCVDGLLLRGWLSQITNNNAQNEYYITDMPKIATEERYKSAIYVTKDAQEIQGCNTFAELAGLERALRKKLCIQAMEQGAQIHDPETTYLHHDTVIGKNVIIEPNVFFGPGVEVEEGAHIKAFSHLEGSKIGRNVSIGPFARLRPGTVIENDVRIGNFVEIKKSKIGKHSKINHLAYVGDTDMGADVNFGAGAITVNYDGFDKHQTKIGKGVMIGSNANLIAPIEIDDGAFVAAGSTIDEDVPADALSITRDKGKIREGWAKAYRSKKKKP